MSHLPRLARLACRLLGLTALLAAGALHANTLSATYFTIAASDADYNHLCCSTSGSEVLTMLGPDGFPMLDPAYTTLRPTDTTAGGELTWWSPLLNSHVSETGTGTITLPFSVPANFYPPTGGGPDDASGGLAAIFSGTLVSPVAQTISFSIGADDSAFAYLDGQLVCSLGGVHAYVEGTCTTPFTVGAGSHSLLLFFDDLNTVQSGLSFDVQTADVTTSTIKPDAVPEPSSLLLLAAGAPLLLVLRRRAARTASR